MKKILVILSTLMATSVLAEKCTVNSIFKDLENGFNKKTICDDVTYAIFKGENSSELDYRLEIDANTSRSTYSVELNSIRLYIDNKLVNDAPGTLIWYPGNSYVILH